MDTSELAGTLTTLFSGLVDGGPQGMVYMPDQGDAGLLRSLERLSAEAASASAHGRPTIAAEARRRMRAFLTEGERNQKKPRNTCPTPLPPRHDAGFCRVA